MVAWKDQMEEYLIVTENDNGLQPDPSNSQRRKKSLIIPAGFNLESEIQCKESTHIQNECEKAGKTIDEMDNFVKSNKFLSGESLSNTEPSQLPTEKQECPSINFVNMETTDQNPSNPENNLKPFTNNGYVDIRTHVENMQEADVQEVDYSRGKMLNSDNTLNLEKIFRPLNSSGYMDVQRQEENISEDYSRVKEVKCDSMVFLQKQNVSVYTSCKEKGNHYTDCALQKTGNPHVTGPIKVGICTELIDSGYVDTIPEPPLM